MEGMEPWEELPSWAGPRRMAALGGGRDRVTRGKKWHWGPMLQELEAKARGRGCVALFSWTGRDRKDSALGVLQKGKGTGTVESRQSPAGCTLTAAALIPRAGAPEHQCLEDRRTC